MQKISKKIILVKDLKKINVIFNSNFYLVSANNLTVIKDLNYSVYKKGLYRYILPGKFLMSIKNYFKKHTYINYNLNKLIMVDLINNNDIVLYKYNNYVFLNNCLILRNSARQDNFKNFNHVCIFRKLFLLCLLFYTN